MMTMNFVLDFALRVTAVLLAGIGLMVALRKASAAERHLAFTGVMVCAILLPLGLFLLPRIEMEIPVPVAQARMASQVLEPAPSSVVQAEPLTSSPMMKDQPARWNITWPGAVLSVLSVGLLVQVLWLAMGMLSLRRVMRRAEPFDVSDETALPAMKIADLHRMPRVFLSNEVTVAFLGGWLKPGIVLPASAKTWPEEKMIMTLGHEMAHLRRGDHWRLGIAALFRVLYWWHPLAPVLLRRWQCERERACDDMVLAGSVRPSDYAALLVEAASEGGKQCLPAVALAMARKQGVRERVEGVLRPTLRRTRESWRTVGALFLLSAGLFWLGGAIQLQAEEKSKTYVEVGSPMVFEVDEEVYRKYQADFDHAVATRGQEAFDELFRKVNRKKGVDITSQSGFMAREGEEGMLIVGLRSDQMLKEMRFEPVRETEIETRANVLLKITPSLRDGTIRLEGTVETSTQSLGNAVTDIKKEPVSLQLQEKEMTGFMTPWPLTNGKGVQKRCFVFLQARSFPEEKYQQFLAEGDAYFQSVLESSLGKVDLKNVSVYEALSFFGQQLTKAQLREIEKHPSTWPWREKNGGFTIAMETPAGPPPTLTIQADDMTVKDFFGEVQKQTGVESIYNSGTLTFQFPSEKKAGLDSASAETHANLATELEYKEPGKALFHQRKAYELEPGSAVFRLNLANLLVRQQQYAEAEGHYKDLLKQEPKNAMLHCNYGVTLYFQGQTDEAIREFEKALEIKPELKDAQANLKVALDKKFGRTPNAVPGT